MIVYASKNPNNTMTGRPHRPVSFPKKWTRL
jgi:hypothetical protein